MEERVEKQEPCSQKRHQTSAKRGLQMNLRFSIGGEEKIKSGINFGKGSAMGEENVGGGRGTVTPKVW